MSTREFLGYITPYVLAMYGLVTLFIIVVKYIEKENHIKSKGSLYIGSGVIFLFALLVVTSCLIRFSPDTDLVVILGIAFVVIIILHFLTWGCLKAILYITKLNFRHKEKLIFPAILWLILGMFITLETIAFFTCPSKITKSDWQGTYHIDREMFAGENADWQYEHFWLKIIKDSLYLCTKEGGDTKIYTRAFVYKRYCCYRYSLDHICIDLRGDTFIKDGSTKTVAPHHMLQHDPLFFAHPFDFTLILHSDKYNNMYFEKQRIPKEVQQSFKNLGI